MKSAFIVFDVGQRPDIVISGWAVSIPCLTEGNEEEELPWRNSKNSKKG